MKNLTLVLSVSFLFACSNKEETTKQLLENNHSIEIPREIPCAENIQKLCSIDGHDCCKIIHLLEKTEIVSPSTEEIEKHLEGAAEKEDSSSIKRLSKELGKMEEKQRIRRKLTQYKNSELEKIGLRVTDAEAHMGPYMYYRLSNGIGIAWHYNPDVLNYRVTEVTLTRPDGTQKIFSTN